MMSPHSLPPIEGRNPILHCVRLAAFISFILVNATAHAAPGNEGAMEKGPIAVAAVIAIGLGIIGFGGYAIWLGAIEQTEKEKAKYRRDSMAAYGFVKPPIPIYKSAITVSIGVAIILGGIIFLMMVPSRVAKTPIVALSPTTTAAPASADRSPADRSPAAVSPPASER